MTRGLPMTILRIFGLDWPDSLRRIAPRSNRTNSIKPELPRELLINFCVSAQVVASDTAFANSAMFGCPITALIEATTLSNGLDETRPNLLTLTWVAAISFQGPPSLL